MRLAVAAALTVVLLGGPTPAGAEEGRGRVLLVGIDGMTFEVLDPLITQGRVPTLARLVQGGARAVLRSERPMRSPALWTTIATGQPRKVHGIYDFVTGSSYWPAAQRGGKRRLVTSTMRRAPAVWQMAGDAGRRSLVVGWLNSWPAERLAGVMVAPYVALGKSQQTTIKGRIYGNGTRETYPPSLFAAIKPLVMPTDAVPAELLARILEAPPRGSRLYREVPRLKRYMYTARWSIASTLTNTAIIEKLLRDNPDTDLVMTYFDGADTLGHRFWVMREPLTRVRARLRADGLDPGLAPELKRRLGHAVEGYYELMDQVVARLLAASGPDTTIIVVSDHGFGSMKGVEAPSKQVPFGGEHRLNGVFIAYGPHIRPGRYEPLTQYAVAPTLLALLSVAVPEWLPGKPATALLDMEALGRPTTAVAHKAWSSRKDEHKPAQEADFHDQELERLRSLGYVQ